MPPRSELRKDPIVEKYVIIAPRRRQRPHDTSHQAEGVVREGCVFCPAQVNRIRPLDVRGSHNGEWRVRVIANKYPAVSVDNPRAYGVQEVVIETPDHLKQLDALPVSHITEIFDVYAARTTALSENSRLQYIMIFKNSGGRAGASISHSHSQVFATDFIPPQLLRRSERAWERYLRTRRCAYCTMIAFEEKSSRCIYRDQYVSVFAPYASENNYEVWMFTRRHVDNITLFSQSEKVAFAAQLKRVLKKITGLKLPYNYYFHQIVSDNDQHFYLKIRPRGSVWAGVEIGSGVIINPVAPEEAARYYRA